MPCELPTRILKTKHKTKSLIAPRALCELCFSRFVEAGSISPDWYIALLPETVAHLRKHFAYGGWCEGKEN